MRNRTVRLDDFIEGLRRFEGDRITKERISEYCSERRIDDASLSAYATFRADRYTRNLLYRDTLFEVMLIGWRPGQKTPVHTHNGQLGWMLVERGGIEVTNYQYLSCNSPESQNVVGIDCLAGATTVDLRELQRESVVERGPVSTVDKIQTMHRIACAPDAGETAVSLHIYSVPFSSCVTFDLDKGSCQRRELFWDTEYGKPAADPTPAPAPLPLLRGN